MIEMDNIYPCHFSRRDSLGNELLLLFGFVRREPRKDKDFVPVLILFHIVSEIYISVQKTYKIKLAFSVVHNWQFSRKVKNVTFSLTVISS